MSRIVFFRIGWMKNYAGYNNGDTISGGGSWPDKGEVFNFLAFRNNYYGYVQPPSNAVGINLSRIVPSATGERLADVTVIWIANRPGGGSFIVGWYQNATVYAMQQIAPTDAKRDYGTGNIGYFAKAKKRDCTLLDDDERTFEIPRGEGYPGRSNTFYQDKNPVFAAEVLSYTESGGVTQRTEKSKNGRARQSDILKRIAVEKSAIKTVSAHYVDLGYNVISVERDNVGWDLTATTGKRTLHLEVKGLSGPTITVELTPNEYRYLSENSINYRLCIVCNALHKPTLHIFSYDAETELWSTKDKRALNFTERVSASISA